MKTLRRSVKDKEEFHIFRVSQLALSVALGMG